MSSVHIVLREEPDGVVTAEVSLVDQEPTKVVRDRLSGVSVGDALERAAQFAAEELGDPIPSQGRAQH